MQTEVILLTALRERLQLPATLSLEATRIQERVYCVTGAGVSWFVKWLLDDDVLGANELRVNRTVLVNDPIPAPRLLFAAPVAGAAVDSSGSASTYHTPCLCIPAL